YDRGRVSHGKRFERNHVEEAECGDIDADSNSQHKNGHDGEPGRAGEDAGSVMEVLEETIEPRPAPGFAGLLAHSQRVAKVVPACACCHLAVEAHVRLEFGIETAAVNEIRDAAPKFAHGEASYAVRRMS